MLRLEGKIAFITGAGSGFGAAIARLFAIEGAKVILADRDELAAKRVAGEIGNGALSIHTDVSDGASVEAAMARVKEAFGGLDILVNNAGIAQKPSALHRFEEAEIDRIFAVNVKSIFHTAVHGLPMLEARGGGTIVNIASNAGMRPRPGMAWYNASKAAVINLTYTMAAELAKKKIRVNAIAPSMAETPMKDFIFNNDNKADAAVLATIPLGRFAQADDIARAALYLASDDAAFVTGAILPVDGGRTAS
jgi:3-oxoacyl-[acyl-carrier protein] reductase